MFKVGDKVRRTMPAISSSDEGFMKKDKEYLVTGVVSGGVHVAVAGSDLLWSSSAFSLVEEAPAPGVKYDDTKRRWHLLPKCAAYLLQDVESSTTSEAALILSARALPGNGAHCYLSAAFNIVAEVFGNEDNRDRLDILEEVVDVLEYGAKKYSPDNWRKVPDLQDRYFSAAMRHYMEYRLDFDSRDAESGSRHSAHLLCCLLFLAEDLIDKGQKMPVHHEVMPCKTT